MRRSTQYTETVQNGISVSRNYFAPPRPHFRCWCGGRWLFQGMWPRANSPFSIFPVNIPDPIRKRFGYGQLWPLRPACSHNRAGQYMPDPTSRIRFSSVFPKKAWIILCKTGPNSTWSGLGQTHLVWKQAGVQESSGPVSGRTQPARFQFATDVPDNIVQNSPDPV